MNRKSRRSFMRNLLKYHVKTNDPRLITVLFLMTLIPKRPKVVAKLPSDVPNLLIAVQDIHDLMTANSILFPTPSPTMAVFQGHINTLTTKEAKMLTGDTVTTSERDTAKLVVELDVEDLVAYTQTIVNGDIPNALTIALKAGMDLKGHTNRGKQEEGAFYTGLTGEIEIVGKVKSYRCAYQWQMTQTPTDLQSWKMEEIDPTLQSKTIVKNLTVGTTYYFRYRVILKEGPTLWSAAFKMMIL